MWLEKLMIEITRNCNLICEHCCRGEKEIINMSIETMDNLFKDIEFVDELLLSGGEPFIAINQIEHLAFLMETGAVKIKRLAIITNATVFCSRTLKVLKRLKSLTILDLRLSDDIFHKFELERLGLLEKRNENIKTLKSLFGLKTHTTTDPKEHRSMGRGLMAAGRAKNITQERLDEINAMLPFNYMISVNFGPTEIPLKIVDNRVKNTVYIDVHGYIVSTESAEFNMEDEEASISNINVNDLPLMEVVLVYSEYYGEKRKKRYERFLGKK